MDITVETIQNALVARLSGRMDATSAPEFEQGFNDWGQGAKKLVVDLGDLEYISSAGLRGILAVSKLVKAQGGSIGFCGMQGMVAEVFRVSGFERLLPVHASLDEALGA